MTTYASSWVCSVCSSTTSSPAFGRRVRVDAERGDAERPPDGLPPERAENRLSLDVVDADGPSRARLAQGVEDDGIDGVVAVHALLEVLDAGPRVERVVAEPGEPLVDLGAQLALERQPVLARAQPEQAIVELVEAAQLVDRSLVVVDAEVDEEVRQGGVAAVRSAPPGERPTAGRAGRLPRPAPRRGTRSAAARGAAAGSPRTSPRARPRSRSRRGCCPARRSRARCGARPSRCSPGQSSSRRRPARRRRRAGARRGPRPPQSAAPRPRSRSAPRAEERARSGRSSGSRTPASRSPPPRAPPTGRPSRPRGTSTGRRPPTASPRGRRRRSRTSRRPGSAIGQLGQVELEQVASLLGHEYRSHLGPRERRPHLLG